MYLFLVLREVYPFITSLSLIRFSALLLPKTHYYIPSGTNAQEFKENTSLMPSADWWHCSRPERKQLPAKTVGFRKHPSPFPSVGENVPVPPIPCMTMAFLMLLGSIARNGHHHQKLSFPLANRGMRWSRGSGIQQSVAVRGE